MERNKLNEGGVFAALAIMLLLIMSPGVSQAVAMYNGDVTLELNLESITPSTTDLDIMGDAWVAGSGVSVSLGDTATASGEAALNAADPDSMVVGDNFLFNANVTGVSGLAAVSSFYSTEGVVILENRTASDYVLRFSYDLSYTGNATTDGLIGENATIDLLLDVVGDISGNQYLGFNVGMNTDLGDPALGYSESGFFDISLASDESEEMVINVSADGNALGVAATEVPAPSALLLMMPGLMMIGWSRSKA